MTLEELSNSDLLTLYSNAVATDGVDSDWVVEIREEIYMRMEGGEGVA